MKSPQMILSITAAEAEAILAVADKIKANPEWKALQQRRGRYYAEQRRSLVADYCAKYTGSPNDVYTSLIREAGVECGYWAKNIPWEMLKKVLAAKGIRLGHKEQ
jgi:hypothetical protein